MIFEISLRFLQEVRTSASEEPALPLVRDGKTLFPSADEFLDNPLYLQYTVGCYPNMVRGCWKCD